MTKNKLFLLLALFLSLGVRAALGLETKEVLGSYELQGVMEMAGGLMLKSDQKYSAMFSYGAADWEEEGSWKLESEQIVLADSHLKIKNPHIPSPFLPSGTRFTYQEGKLTGTDSTRKLVFINPNKTPSPRVKSADSAGEGRMRVKGKVVKLDSDVLIVKTDECIQFSVRTLSEATLKTAKANLGKMIDVEIPYSSIIAGGSCP